MERGLWLAIVHGVARVGHDFVSVSLSLYLSVSLSVSISLGGCDPGLSLWSGAVTGVHSGSGGTGGRSRRHWAVSRGLGGVSRSWVGAPGSSHHTRSGAHEPCFLWPPEPRGRRRAVSQQPRALTTGRQELALQPIWMGPGGRGGPGQPCMPSSLGSHPSPASGPLLPGQPRAQWAPGVRVSISRAAWPHAQLTPGVCLPTAVLTLPWRVTRASILGPKCSAVATGGQGAALRGCPPGVRGPHRPAWPTSDPSLPLLAGLRGAHSCQGASHRAAGRAEPHCDAVQAPCPPCALGSSWHRGGGSPRRPGGQWIHSANPADSPASAI